MCDKGVRFVLKDYVILNDFIRQQIKTERTKRKINGVKFSQEVLGKSDGYLSHIEKGVIKKIQPSVLEKIFSNMLNISGNDLAEYLNKLLNQSDNSEINKKNMPDYQKLYEDRQEEIIEKLKEIFWFIEDDLSNYPPDYEDCEEDDHFESVEKHLTTFIELWLNSDIEIFHQYCNLMRLPLHKLNPVQFQRLVEVANELLEYEYVFESGENSKTQKYPHFRTKYKEKLQK